MKEESLKTWDTECFVVASRPFMEKAIGVFYDIKEAIELRDNKNKSTGLKCFNVYPAIISIEKKALGE